MQICTVYAFISAIELPRIPAYLPKNAKSDPISRINFSNSARIAFSKSVNDYIHFHLRRADGSYLSVLDHGRIVESQQYGKVFYVLFMDWEDMNSHYSEKFSG